MIDFKSIDNSELYNMCRNGDDDAWKYIHTYILGICREWDLSVPPEELAQDIILKVTKNIGALREENSFRAYVKRSAINKIRDSFRAIGPKITVSMDQPIKNKKGEEFVVEYPSNDPLPITDLISGETFYLIDAALKKLSGVCEKVLREYFKYKIGIYEDYKELSKVLQMKGPTVASRVIRCLTSLIKFEEIKMLEKEYMKGNRRS